MRPVASMEAQRGSTASSSARAVPRRVPPLAGPWLYLGPGLALYALFVLWPLAQVVWLGLQRWNGYGPQRFVGLANFRALWADPIFHTSLSHSAGWELAAAVLPTLLALGLALLLWRSRHHRLFLTVLFFPALLPATVVAAVWTLVYSPLTGLLNTLLSDLGLTGWTRDWLGDPRLALGSLFAAWAWSALGVGTLVLWTALRGVNREYLELAAVEGADVRWRFQHVIMPTLRRPLLVVLLVNASLAGQVFDLVFVTTGGGPGYATMLLPLDIYGRAFGGQTGAGAAAATIQVALNLLLAALALLLVRRPGLDTAAEPPASSAWAWTGIVLGPFLLLFLLPLLWLLRQALSPGRALALGSGGPGLAPWSWDWNNLSGVWNAGMGSAYLTSLLLALGVTLGTLALAAPAAFALVRLVSSARLRAALAALLLAGLLQPTPVLVIPLFSLLREVNLLDTPWGILLPDVARAFPFAVLLLWAFLGHSREALEAAAVDGATSRQQMLWVALPLARPALYAAAIWAFLTSWNDYLLPTLVSQDGSLQTVPTLLSTFIGKYDTQFGLLAAGSLLAMLPSLAMYLVLRRPAGAGLARAERRLL